MKFIPEQARIVPVGMAALLVVVVVFAVTRFLPLWSGASIKVSGLTDGNTLESSFSLTGRAKYASELYINDYQVPVDSGGNFASTLNLPAGYTVLTVEAIDRFGNDTKKTYRVLVKDAASGPALGINTASGPIIK